MSDLIDRQQAIDALYHVDEYNGRSVEAIRNLPSVQPDVPDTNVGNMISRQAVIDIVRSECRCGEQMDLIEELKALPSAQPKQTDCEYCHEDSDGYVTPIEKNCHAFIRFGMNGWEISLRAKGWNGSAKIMYCPMCGRELKT